MDDCDDYHQTLIVESPQSPHSITRSVNQSINRSYNYSTIHELEEDRTDEDSINHYEIAGHSRDGNDSHFDINTDSINQSINLHDSNDYLMHKSSNNKSIKQSVVESSPLSPTSPSFFRYQVAGHSLLLWHAGTVCKPLIHREHDWYTHAESFLPILIPFIPKFYGVLDTDTMSESIKQELGLGAAPTSTFNRAVSSSPKRSPGHQSNNSCPFASSLVAKLTRSTSHTSITQSMSSRYLVIEDLTFAYSQPCIMDLKVGTRQHGLEDSVEKIASKARKCATSTSSRLGLRLCGMQVYHPASGRSVHRDKYAGRALSVSGFMSTLREFFSDGRRLRWEIMSALLARLCLFRATLAQLPYYRFYSSSLLLVYEGANVESDSPLCDLANPRELLSYTAASVMPLIDSLLRKDPIALEQALGSLSNYPSKSPALRQSLDALMKAASQLSINVQSWHSHNSSLHDDEMCPSTPTACSTPDNHSDKPLYASVRSVSNPDLHANTSITPLSAGSSGRLASDSISKFYTTRRKTTQAKARERARARGNVDIRLIDFAHTARVDCPRVANSDDDEGLLFGFDQLIQAVSQLMDEQHHDMQQES